MSYTCAICLESVYHTRNNVVLACCTGVFHRACVQRMLVSNAVRPEHPCPLCRTILSPTLTDNLILTAPQELVQKTASDAYFGDLQREAHTHGELLAIQNGLV